MKQTRKQQLQRMKYSIMRRLGLTKPARNRTPQPARHRNTVTPQPVTDTEEAKRLLAQLEEREKLLQQQIAQASAENKEQKTPRRKRKSELEKLQS